MSLSGSVQTLFDRTIDGLIRLDVDQISINGQPVNLADLFNKVTDDSDDILQGVAQLFVSPAEKADFHKPVTVTAPGNGLSVGGTTGQELTLSTASGSSTGALTSADWTTFNSKEPAITGAATSITSANLTVDRALVSDGSGKVAVSTTTATELSYVSGVTSSIQGQINALSGTSVWQQVVIPPSTNLITPITTPSRVSIDNELRVKDQIMIGTPVTTSEKLYVNGTSRFDSNMIINNAATLEMRGANGFCSGKFGFGMSNAPAVYALETQGGLKANYALVEGAANAISIVGSTRVFQEWYPRGIGAGRKAYLGFDNAGTTNFVAKNEDSGAIVLINSNNNQFILNADGTTQHISGNTSYCTYGPNIGPNPSAPWNGLLAVGAGSTGLTGSKTAAIQVTDGNLHIDVANGAGYAVYTNFYSAGASSDNKVFRDYSSQWFFGSRGTGGTNRDFQAPMMTQSIILHYTPYSPVQLSPAVNTWGVMLAGVFQIALNPLRQTSFFKIRVKLSVSIRDGSSVAFRVMRNVAGVNTPFAVSSVGVNRGHSRTAPVANEPGYWMNSPTYIEVWDYPNTTSTVTYYIEHMTYNAAFGYFLNYVTIGGAGGDATGVISTMTVQEHMFGSIVTI